MTPSEAYKFGFLYRCVEEGLDASKTQSRIDRGLNKQAGATETAMKVLGGLGGAGKSIWELGMSGFPLAMLAGAVGGTGLGATAAHLERRELDDDEIRRRELIDTYNLFADRALEKAKNNPLAGAGKEVSFGHLR